MIKFNQTIANNRKNILVRYYKHSLLFPQKEVIRIHIRLTKEFIMSYKAKGWKLFLLSYETGLDGDDFVRYLMTCVTKWKAYKKPRFIK